jgi:signal transduction histidine kinase
VTRRFARRPVSPWAFDIALTGVLTVLGVGLLFTYRPDDGIDYLEPDLFGALLIIVFTVPLAFRRQAPLVTALVLAALNVPHLLWTYSVPTGAIVALIAVYSLGLYATFGRGLVGLAALLGSTYVYLIVIAGQFPDAEPASRTAMAFVALGFFGAWAIGRSVRAPRLYARYLEERADQLERTHQAETRAAVAEERSQIARELHDVVAHHVSVMTVQAAGARRTLARDPDRSREALEAIEATGRAALAEMRRIVGVLRGPDDDAPAASGRSPQPGLADLPELVEQLGAAGLPVDVQVDGDQRELPLGIDLTAYRVVQEALTNTLKHAAATHAEVTLHYSPRELVVDVVDDGRGQTSGPDARRLGLGLLGMRERLALYGGDLEAGSRAEAGFRVHARIPLRDGP